MSKHLLQNFYIDDYESMIISFNLKILRSKNIKIHKSVLQ